MKIGIIGLGAIGRFVRYGLRERGHDVRAVLLRPQRLREYPQPSDDVRYVASAAELPGDIDHVVDCAGHGALKAYGADILQRGTDLTTVSIGALADEDLYRELERAATAGKSTLHLATGAIGALDCLRAARVGKLESVMYVGRKPPAGWKGSAAEARLDLDRLDDNAQIHFSGSARDAATDYPKNANVAAAVALAGIGFDRTLVELIADPGIDENIHEIRAEGDFGRFAFEIRGRALPDNARSSALAAMSVISTLDEHSRRIRF